MSTTTAAGPPPTAAEQETAARTLPAPPPAVALTFAYAVLAAGLIALRAAVSSLGFVGVGWLLVLALVPFLPLLLPRLGPAMASLSPYVKSFKLPGGIEVALQQAESSVVGLGGIAWQLTEQLEAPGQPPGAQPQFTTTAAMTIVQEMQRIHAQGGGVVTVDLASGSRWRLANLYFLARLLEAEPLVERMAFTETRGGSDGFFVGTCDPADLRLQLERRVPAYAVAGSMFAIPPDMSVPGIEEPLSNQFTGFRNLLPPEADEWVTPATLVGLLGPRLETSSLEWRGAFGDEDVRQLVLAPHRFVGLTVGGRFQSAVDRDPVALVVARAAVGRV